MIKLLRTLLYSSIVLGALASLSYLIYFAPGQLQTRATRSLEKYLAAAPSVTGARQVWMGPLTIERIQIPSAPVIDQRDFLLLYGIEVEDAGQDPFSLPDPAAAPPEGSAIRIQKARLLLDHEALPDSAGSLFSVAQWNWRDLFRDGSLLAAVRDASQAGHHLEVGQVDLEVQEIRRRQEKSSWSARIEDLSIEGADGGVLEVRGDLPPTAYWSEGQFVARYRSDPVDDQPAIEAQGFLDDLHGLDDWLALLFPMERRLAALLSPAGPITFTLNSLAYFPARGPAGAAGGRIEHRSTLRHYDSAFRIAPWDLEVRHVHGVMTVDPAGISFGSTAGKEDERLSGEFWGTDVDFRGRIGPQSAEVAVRLAETDLKSAAVSAQPKELAAIWRRLRPAGKLSGELGFAFGAEGSGSFSVSLDFGALSFEDLPILGPATGKLALRGTSESGIGLLTIASASIEPLGKISGEVPVEWSAHRVTVKPASFSLGDGRLLGELEIELPGRSIRGSLRFDGASMAYADGLLAATRAGGKVDFVSGPDGVAGHGSVDLEEIALDLKRLGAGEIAGGAGTISFSQGQILFTLTPEGMRPLRIDLRGGSGALRFQGSVGSRGGIDGVGVLAMGESARTLALLPSSSLPREWRQAVGGGSVALRLSGNSLHPRIRAVEWTDPLFQDPAGAPAVSVPAGEKPAPAPAPPVSPPQPAKKP